VGSISSYYGRERIADSRVDEDPLKCSGNGKRPDPSTDFEKYRSVS